MAISFSCCSRNLRIDDEWLAYQLDSAVVAVGSSLEAASQEMEKVGSEDKPEFRQKYTMQQLLDDDFRLPLRTAVERPIEADIKGVQGVMFDEVS